MEALAASQSERFAKAVSRLLGWIYTICWSASFYPQPILNWQRKSTVGTVIDFSTLNNLGFVCLTISNTAFLFSPTIRSQYAARHPKAPEPTVRFNDLAYAVHALILSGIVYSQFWRLIWGFEVGNSQTASRPVLAIFWACIVAVVVAVIAVGSQESGGHDPSGWAWIDAVYIISYVKLVVTFVKYIPQAWLNYKRKSTRGWSITQILLDVTGGFLSVVQLIMDSSFQNDWSGITGNPLKFGLGNITVVFDVIFMAQHYVLYREAQSSPDKIDEERDPAEEPLLPAA